MVIHSFLVQIFLIHFTNYIKLMMGLLLKMGHNYFYFQYLILINSYLVYLLKNYLMSILLILFFCNCFSFQKIGLEVVLVRFQLMQICWFLLYFNYCIPLSFYSIDSVFHGTNYKIKNLKVWMYLLTFQV